MPPKTPKKKKVGFVEAAQKEGYLKKGGAFRPLPRKGTSEYEKIVRHLK